MPRKPRYIPPGGCLVEVSNRTLNERFLLRPDAEVEELSTAILARASKLFAVRVCYAAMLSNHFHLLLRTPDAKALADFMCYFQSNLAREINRLRQRRGAVFSSRYNLQIISHETLSQLRRLRYLVEQGCKEDLVASPMDWPGLHSIQALLKNDRHSGRWARKSKKPSIIGGTNPDAKQKRPKETIQLQLAPLPALESFPPSRRRQLLRNILRSIEQQTAARHAQRGTQPLGAVNILSQSPLRRPVTPKFEPLRGFIRAASRQARQALEEGWREFLRAYRTAAALQQKGKEARFPPGSFPPRGPFVPALADS